MKYIFKSMVFVGIFFSAAFIAKASFSDVSDSYAYKDAIGYVQSASIVSGYSDGTYKPESSVNRAEFTKIVVNSFYKDEIENTYLCHVTYKKALSTCENSTTCEKVAFVNFGACMGYASDSEGNPNPQSSILQVYDTCFPDVPLDAWFRKYVCHAKMKGLIGGYPDGTFKPEQNVSLVESAKIFSNAFGFATSKDDIWYRPYVGALADRKAIPSTLRGFTQNLKRGELAEMLYRLREHITNKDSMSYASLH